MRFLISIVFALISCAALAASPVPSNGVISTPGDYYLPTNRSSNGANYVLLITADNVDLNLNGKIVQCTPPSPASQTTWGFIASGRTNVKVRNGWMLGCVYGGDVSSTTKMTVDGVKTHARKTGYFGGDNNAELTIKNLEIYSVSGTPSAVYATGIDRPGNDCLIENVTFRDLHRQAGADPQAAGEGVAVIFSPGSTGCVARQNWHENSNMSHLEIGYWVGNATVTIEENSFTNIGRAIAASPGYDLIAKDNRFLMRTAQTGSYAIGAQQGLASGNVIIGYDNPIQGYIPETDNLIFP